MKANTTLLCLALGLGLSGVSVLTGCQSGSRYERSTGEYIDDKTLDQHVKAALHDNPEYKFGEVIVTAFKGTVQLSGFVNTTEQKKSAAEIVAKVPGVKTVDNKITVKEKVTSLN